MFNFSRSWTTLVNAFLKEGMVDELIVYTSKKFLEKKELIGLIKIMLLKTMVLN